MHIAHAHALLSIPVKNSKGGEACYFISYYIPKHQSAKNSMSHA